jgi:hypothetical protein
MEIPVEEQLEAYATWKTRELLARHGIETIHDGLFAADRRDVRTLFTFTWQQLVDHLRKHPDYVDSYMVMSDEMHGIYDKEILEREDGRYVRYNQDHDGRRDEYFYADRFEAAADWLTAQYGMWLHEEV